VTTIKTKLEVDDLSTLADMLPETRYGCTTRWREKRDRAKALTDVSGVGEAEEHLDDPELNMRAGFDCQWRKSLSRDIVIIE